MKRAMFFTAVSAFFILGGLQAYAAPEPSTAPSTSTSTTASVHPQTKGSVKPTKAHRAAAARPKASATRAPKVETKPSSY